jgi:hypothetical protein
MFEQNGGLRYSVICSVGHTVVGVFSNWSIGTCLCMGSTLLLSQYRMLTHTHFGKCSLNNFASSWPQQRSAVLSQCER